MPLEGCPACHTLDEADTYGLGVVLSGGWILQNPLFGGYGAIEAYLSSRQIAIAVATTFGEQAFDETGNNRHDRASWESFAAIGDYLAPEDAAPGRAYRVDHPRGGSTDSRLISNHAVRPVPMSAPRAGSRSPGALDFPPESDVS